jgi:hypothetical protein
MFVYEGDKIKGLSGGGAPRAIETVENAQQGLRLRPRFFGVRPDLLTHLFHLSDHTRVDLLVAEENLLAVELAELLDGRTQLPRGMHLLDRGTRLSGVPPELLFAFPLSAHRLLMLAADQLLKTRTAAPEHETYCLRPTRTRGAQNLKRVPPRCALRSNSGRPK